MFEKEAEEYTKGLCKTCTLDTCRNNTVHTCAIKEYIKQAFLAGLKAGKDMNVATRWHKVADGYLPKENRTVLDEAGDRFYYFRGQFYYESDSRFDCQPIAWCEIPKYTEKI